MSIAFSSDYLCGRYARDEIKRISEKADLPTDQLLAILIQYCVRLEFGGKIDQHDLRKTARQAFTDIKALPTVLDCALKEPYSRSSSKYLLKLAVLMGAVTEVKDRVDIFISDATFTSKSITCNAHNAIATVSQHTLARYLSRERRTLAGFFNHIKQPIRLAFPLAQFAEDLGIEQLFLPYGSGMVIGHLKKSPPKTGVHIKSVRGRQVVMKEPPDTSLLNTLHCQLDIKTYIDESSLTDRKRAILNRVRRIEREFDGALQNMYEMMGIRTAFNAEVHPDMDRLGNECFALLTSPEWKAVASNTRRLAA